MLTVSSVVLLAQIAADPISGGAGWIGAGLLGAVLAWLMFVHLPGKDKLIRELQAESQAFVQRLMDRHDAAVRAQQEMFTSSLRGVTDPSADPGHLAPTATTVPSLEDFCSFYMSQSLGSDDGYIFQAQTLDPDNYGSDIWLYPAPGPSALGGDPRTYSGRVVAIGRYAAWYPDDGKVYTGLTGVITIHDENGTDQELTLCGGLVVGWSGIGPAALP